MRSSILCSLLENTGDCVWGVWGIAERNPRDVQEVSGIPEVGAGRAMGQESLELKLAPSRRHGCQLEPPG